MMGPPKQKNEKRPAEAVVPTPSTPTSAAPTTPRSEAGEPPKKQSRRKGPEEQTPLTPLQKARDMCQKLLKKKSDAGNLSLTLQSIPYADALSKEMSSFAQRFEFLGSMWFGFVSAKLLFVMQCP